MKLLLKKYSSILIIPFSSAYFVQLRTINFGRVRWLEVKFPTWRNPVKTSLDNMV